MKILKKISELEKELLKLRENNSIGFVPTMGAIHQGHLSLAKESNRRCDITIVSIFVNKKQFNDKTDYEKYPDVLEQDIKVLKKENVNILFIPEDSEIYPDGEDLKIDFEIKNLSNKLCGINRMGHFDGVAIIIHKLFDMIKPNYAFFGEKDFQQLQIIRKVNDDFGFNVNIVGCKIIREKSGLAMSSRNLRLSKQQLLIASKIYKNLLLIKEALSNDHQDLNLLLKKYKKKLLDIGFDKIDYLEIRDEKNLELVNNYNKNIRSRIFIALYLNQIRLIDNIKLY